MADTAAMGDSMILDSTSSSEQPLESQLELSRRALLKQLGRVLCGLAGLGMGLLDPSHQVPRRGLAIGRPTQITVGLLTLPGAEANPRPGVIELMLFELARNTSVEVNVEAQPIEIREAALFDHPLLFLFGTRAFPALSTQHRDRLELYLRAGGMLFIDDNSGLSNSGFDDSVRREVRAIFPRTSLERIYDKHVLYRTFFLLPGISGRARIKPYLEGIELGDEVTPLLYSRNDLAGAFARDPVGGYLYECVPGGEQQRLAAYKLGINLLMYALCLNYKHDLTHVRALLKRPRGVFDQ